MKILSLICVGCIGMGCLFSCFNTKEQKDEIQVFAAAGTTLAVDSICDEFQQTHTISILRNYASSGTLARQIYNGAQADILISANKDWMDYLKQKDLLVDSSIKVLAGNTLVIVCPVKNDSLEFRFNPDMEIQKTTGHRIVIGNPAYVPAGKYAREALTRLNWHTSLENQMLLAKDVVSVLKYVELGEADWGIVYYSEALKSNKVRIVAEIPGVLYSPVVFYISLTKGYHSDAMELYQYFLDSASMDIFSEYGFLTE